MDPFQSFYHQDDGPSLEEIAVETLVDDPAGSVNIKSSEDLNIGALGWSKWQFYVSLTSSSSKISADEYTARAKVIRACTNGESQRQPI